MFERIDQLRNQLQDLRHRRQTYDETEQSIREKFIVDWTYHSNAIEGNTLTLQETRIVLEQGITIGGKTVKEHLEVIDHKEAIFYLEELVQANQKLSEWLIKQLHRLILNRIQPQDAGQYRSVPVTVGDHLLPQPWEVSIQMEQFIEHHEQSWSQLHPLQRASYLQCDFVRIHPFIDGNGRTARLIMNLELMKQGYPPVILPVEERAAYYHALQRYDDTGNVDEFLTMLIPLTEQSLAFHLSVYGK